MKRTILGQSGLDVPVFALGTAPLAHVPVEQGMAVLRRAYELGATWWDTSDDYGSIPVITRVLPDYPRERLTISTKTAAKTEAEGADSVRQALHDLNTDYVDIMFLHYVRSEEDFVARQGALQAFREAKARGQIRAIGLSSHDAEPFFLAAQEPAIDVVLIPWNAQGQMPGEGSRMEMERAIDACYRAHKGVVLMKLLASGRLRPVFDKALRAGAQFPQKHALNIGVSTVHELDADLRLVLGEPVDSHVIERLRAGGWEEAA